jgi:hypothetical protein
MEVMEERDNFPPEIMRHAQEWGKKDACVG